MTKKQSFDVTIVQKPKQKAIVHCINKVVHYINKVDMIVIKFGKGYQHAINVSDDGIVNITAKKKNK